MKQVILNIAGIRLKLGHPLPPIEGISKFILPCAARDSAMWRFQSVGVNKKAPERENNQIKEKVLKLKARFLRFKKLDKEWYKKKNNLSRFNLPRRHPPAGFSFYFNHPVFIDIKNKYITYFYLKKKKEAGKGMVDSRLITYAYAQILAVNKGLLLHATGVIKNQKAYLFLGSSGAGKSTVAKLSGDYQVLGDDVIAVRKKSADFFAFPTPWKQDNFSQSDKCLSAAIAGVFFLKRSKRIAFRPLRQEEALARILLHHTHFFLYIERPLLENLFFTCAEFIKSVPAYEMEFRRDAGFWPELEDVLAKG